jgi:phenylacetic acid degradation operon negative regulatory protein
MSLPAPVLSRRHATGSESARGLLFTVLGELVLPTGGSAYTSAFIDVLSRLGVEEKTSRQALMRTAADGWLASERLGRRTIWRLTPAAEQLLIEGTNRIFGFTAIADDWDGRWALVLASEPDRAARHLLRTRFRWAGFGSPAPGVWVSPHADRAKDIDRLSPDLQIFLAEHYGGGPLTAMVRQAWDLDALERAYEEFLSSFQAPAREPLAGVIDLVHAWRRFPFIDPELPSEFLPPGWSGTEAAALFTSRHASWVGGARTEWQSLSGATASG